MTEPIYRRIARDLRRNIESGTLAPGSQLPTELDLKDTYSASRQTVRDAMKWLANHGLVEARPGQGTFVIERNEPFLTTLTADWQADGRLGGGEGQAARNEVVARSRTLRASVPRVELRLAEGNVASRLCVPNGTNVIIRHQELFQDGKPWSLQRTYYPMALAKDAPRLLDAADIDEGTVQYLADTCGIKQIGLRDQILFRPANENEAAYFRLADDGRIPVVVLLRTGFSSGPDHPVPFRLTESILLTRQNQFIINAGEVPDRLAPAAA